MSSRVFLACLRTFYIFSILVMLHYDNNVHWYLITTVRCLLDLQMTKENMARFIYSLAHHESDCLPVFTLTYSRINSDQLYFVSALPMFSSVWYILCITLGVMNTSKQQRLLQYQIINYSTLFRQCLIIISVCSFNMLHVDSNA